ncbi:hypothetical protein SBA4_2120044 [Candidatus Sulfopaludibacter sp. SbA4]|nr:hypothetical protein SBA4_2120044 [Candidatus Sulfopaludibacter sp. SbA4]
MSGQSAIFQTLSGKSAPSPLRPFTLSWSHYVFLLRVKNPNERSFYEIESNEQNWTVRELKRQFNSGLYERLALSRDKEGIRRLAQEGQNRRPTGRSPQGTPGSRVPRPGRAEPLFRVRPRIRHPRPDRALSAGNGQRLPLRGAPKALHLRRRTLLRGPGFL